MGRYDFLLNEEPQKPITQEQVKKPDSPIARKEASLKGSNQAIQKASNPESLKARKEEKRKVPKYSTQLKEELQIEVDVFAARHKMAEYEVVQKAIEEFLERHN